MYWGLDTFTWGAWYFFLGGLTLLLVCVGGVFGLVDGGGR